MNMAFNELVAKRALGIATAADFSDWAENLLAEGCDSANVAILAGLTIEGSQGIYEAEAYFTKCVAELGLILPDEREAIFEYAKCLAKNICDGILEPEEGLALLKCFWRATDNEEPLYIIWDELADDINTLDDSGGYSWNTSLSEHNVDAFILQVARQFLQLSAIDLPDSFFSLCVCGECGYIGKAQLIRLSLPWLPEKLYQLVFKKSPVFKWVCGKCANPNIKNMFDYDGRKLYLESKNI
jgi:hypothetical protein